MYKVLQTDRLNIRPIRLNDAEFIIKLVNSEGWLKFIGDRNIRTKLDAENYIQKILDNSLFFYSVFELRSTNQSLGIITFLKRDNQKYPDIGFALLPEFEKNGFTFEAAKKYLDEIILHSDYEKVIGITLSDNTNSIKILEKLGLTYQNNYTERGELLSTYSKTLT